jgi:LacI family gluconate utilization system Gnt-I transcriptional repressor
MARYLHERGRRRIGFIGSGVDRDLRGFERRAGYAQAMRELGLAADRIVAVGAPPASMSQGPEALDLMLRQWPDTDAIVCVSDLVAFGVLAECQRRGVEVPGRIALIGFGDFEVSRYCHPRLTTVGVDCAAIGRRSAEIVIEALESGAGPAVAPRRTTIVDFAVIERETA